MVTLKFNNSYIKDWFTIAGPEEINGNIKNVNMSIKDLYYGEDTLEQAEIKMQKTVISNLSSKHNFDLVIGGDLSNQLGNMNMALRDYKKSFLGLYNACSTFVEGIIVGSEMLTNRNLKDTLILTSSHALTSERQFRFPIEYGSLKACYTTCTITAAIGTILTNEKTKYKVTAATIGNVVDYGINDVANMGAIMAPAAASVINSHLINTKTSVDDYDYILTGDLGNVGLELLHHILKDDYGITTNKILDAGAMIYKKNQNKCAGGSGPTCLPYVFFNKLIKNKETKRVLLVGTGALHNPTLVNQKNTIPSIAHLIEIEVNHDN